MWGLSADAAPAVIANKRVNSPGVNAEHFVKPAGRFGGVLVPACHC
jgi:hypothetical protein